MIEQLETSDDHLNWYVALLKPNGLRAAERNLEQQGFVTFVPRSEVALQRRGKFITEIKPLFAGYLFIRAEPDLSHWRCISSTYGVSRLIRFGAESAPKMVPQQLMKALMMRCDVNGIFHYATDFSAGDTVLIKSGPFANLLATVTQMSTVERISVLLNIMGRSTEVSMSAKHVQSALLIV